MNNWKSHLKNDPTDWLLEESDPSVQYFALKWILDLTEDDPRLSAASQLVSQSAPVQKLLSRRRIEGYWGSDDRPHHGTKRYLKLLMWLGFPGNHQVKDSMDYLIDGCLRDDGAYVIELKGRPVELPCHAADLVRLMLWFGYKKDPRIKRLLDWLVNIQGSDGVWPCVSKLRPFSCMWATVDVLRAYNDLPLSFQTSKIIESRQLAIEQILNSNIYQYGKGKISERWFEFGYPLRFDTDILEALELIAPFVSPEHETVREALSLVLEKQQSDGRWLCEKHPKGGRWMQAFIEFEEIGQPSKWVTLHCMYMLKTLFGGV